MNPLLDIPTCGTAKAVPPPPPYRESRRFYSWAIFACTVALIVWSAMGTGTDLRVFLHRDAWFQMGTFVSGLFPPDLSWQFIRSTLWSGVETLALSLMGTVLAVLIALPLGVISSRTLLFGIAPPEGKQPVPSARLMRAIPYWGGTLGLNLLRSIPELFWALIFILAVGLGPFAGVLALGFHTGGVLGKLFSEVIEDVDPQPLEALQATGAPTAAILAYGIFPLALPQLLSYTLYRWEVNIRAAAIIGVVGAGGIGRDIYVAISLFHYQQLFTLLLMTLVIVTLVDYFSAWVRALQRV
ncbi:MAG TPA: phosphonate ABC transporter, permease protein PhnE [Candidatus Tectomicrobia bacterium]|nr:phosphonate ABC transporter, permease protein PhnE [Candidatus Tectomicrobia bacterium]